MDLATIAMYLDYAIKLVTKVFNMILKALGYETIDENVSLDILGALTGLLG